MEKGFFLGRSTPQWLSLIGGTLAFIGILINQFAPEALGTYTTIAGGLTTLALVYLAFLTNTATTPTFDARLQAGTSLTLTDPEGNNLSSVTLPTAEEVATPPKKAATRKRAVKVPQLAEVPVDEGKDGAA